MTRVVSEARHELNSLSTIDGDLLKMGGMSARRVFHTQKQRSTHRLTDKVASGPGAEEQRQARNVLWQAYAAGGLHALENVLVLGEGVGRHARREDARADGVDEDKLVG